MCELLLYYNIYKYYIYNIYNIYMIITILLSREKRDIAITFVCLSVCLFVCLFVSRISHKLQVGFWWNLVSREVMIIGRPSSKLGVIRIEIRIWDPDNFFSWTTGRILDQDFNQIEDNSNLIMVIW